MQADELNHDAIEETAAPAEQEAAGEATEQEQVAEPEATAEPASDEPAISEPVENNG